MLLNASTPAEDSSDLQKEYLNSRKQVRLLTGRPLDLAVE